MHFFPFSFDVRLLLLFFIFCFIFRLPTSIKNDKFFTGIRFINCFQWVCKAHLYIFFAAAFPAFAGNTFVVYVCVCARAYLSEPLVFSFHWKLSLSYFLHKKWETFYFSHYDYHDKLFQFILIWSWPTFLSVHVWCLLLSRFLSYSRSVVHLIFERKDLNMFCALQNCMCMLGFAFCLWCVAATFLPGFFATSPHSHNFSPLDSVFDVNFLFRWFYRSYTTVNQRQKVFLSKNQPYFLFHIHAELIYVFSNIYGFYLFHSYKRIQKMGLGYEMSLLDTFSFRHDFYVFCFSVRVCGRDEVISFEFSERTVDWVVPACNRGRSWFSKHIVCDAANKIRANSIIWS